MKGYEKHNVHKVIIEKSLLEFTAEEIYSIIDSNRRWVNHYYCSIIEEHLHQLSIEGKIYVRYISQGSRTVARYKSLKAARNERIDNILK